MAKDFSIPEVTGRELQQGEPFRLNQVLKLLAEQLTRVQGQQGPFTFGPNEIDIPTLVVLTSFLAPGGAKVSSGNGNPNGQVVGAIGDMYLRRDGGAGTVLWIKESNSGTNLGWISK